MNKNRYQNLFNFFLLCIIFTGICFRFTNMDWDSGALLHPDEYGLTNTLTRLSIPRSISNYFNTRESTLSPYNQYDLNGQKTVDGPDNRMRWGQLPMLIIRLTAEAVDTTGYTELRRTGRYVSAIIDTGTLILLFLMTWMLFHSVTMALLSTALSSMAVMQIQQSHFMTVDTFAVFFCMLTLLAAVKISQSDIIRKDTRGIWQITSRAWLWFGLFGIFLGMAISCKINHAVLGMMVVVAAFIAIAEQKLSSKKELRRIILLALGMCLFSAIMMVLSFRLFQPMSFRAPTGNTSLLTWHINRDWWDSMQVAAAESSGIGGGPPSEQWAHRIPVLFPLINMIFYGMGVPLGIAVWIAGLYAILRIIRSTNSEWKALLIPVVWSFFFFLFMGTRFVKCIRYMLPVYPTFCLLAAWGLTAFWKRANGWKKAFPAAATCFVLSGAIIWAAVFVNTIYGQEHSRVEAVRWIYENIPAVFQLAGTDESGENPISIPVNADSVVPLSIQTTFEQTFIPASDIRIFQLSMPHVRSISQSEETRMLEVQIIDPYQQVISDSIAALPKKLEDGSVDIPLNSTYLKKGERYSIRVNLRSGSELMLRRNVIANENWDEGLPFPLDGYDPFGQLYNGITNQVRWSDNEEKKKMLLDTLEKSDYLILPSQRGMWSVCRIPLTYPMTIAYYEALFDGNLGFELVAAFQRPFRIGPLVISDLAGTVSWNQQPQLPIKNLSIWSAEEAFSVYDHPPVWIFKKSSHFNLQAVKALLDQIDLSAVVNQGPTDAIWPEGYGKE